MKARVAEKPLTVFKIKVGCQASLSYMETMKYILHTVSEKAQPSKNHTLRLKVRPSIAIKHAMPPDK